MGKSSKIEWCDHTFNPWEGCTKVSAGCANCYAETRAKRFKHGTWGPNGNRRRTSENYWKQPIKWNLEAKLSETRPRVFCASLADIFEDRPELLPWLSDLLALIIGTPHLCWLLLTKRPENVNRLIEQATGFSSAEMWFHAAPHVAMGTSVEDQNTADERIPYLLQTDAAVKFLSVEPMIGSVSITGEPYWDWRYSYEYAKLAGFKIPIDWVICGGESGAKARPMNAAWVRSLRDQCVRAKMSFFFKQWGEYDQTSRRVGKKIAGRRLDGRTWDEFPRQPAE